MAQERSRLLPHFYLPGQGQARSYTAHPAGGGDSANLPVRDRATHAEQLTKDLTDAIRAGESLLERRDPVLAGGTPGFYLEFELPKSQANIVERLENRRGHFPIELVSVRPLTLDQEKKKIAATVFVPEKQRDYYLKKVEAYRREDRKPNSKGETGPKNEKLIASIDTARLAVTRSLYTDEPDIFPDAAQTVWWEVWLRKGTRSTFDGTYSV